ncbi:PAS domain S-box protein [Roseivirga sp.]|uniref:PAS domain S-box protein n=1 Tax=Roseivirga sp. TaxID=1964215 RepID=UPI003B524DD7
MGRATVWDIAQDQRGFLWMATSEGIVRFDGREAVVFDLGNTPSFDSNEFTQIEVETDGTIWAAGRSGLFFLNNESFVQWTSEHVVFSSIKKIITDPDGGILLLADKKVYFVINEQVIAAPYQLTNVLQIKLGFDGRIWVVLQDNSVKYIHDDQLHDFDNLRNRIDSPILTVVDDAEGNVYLSLRNGQVVSYRDDKFSVLFSSETDQRVGLVRDLFPDSHGFVWMSSVTGAYRLSDKGVERLSVQDGLSEDGIRTVFEDVNGDIWIGAFRGLYLIHRSPVGRIRYSQDDRYLPIETKSIIQDSRGYVWVGTDRHGLFRLENSQLSMPKGAATLPANIYTIFEDRDGDLLLGGESGLFKVEVNGNEVRLKEKISTEDTRFVFATKEGVVWVNTRKRGSTAKTYLYSNGRLEQNEFFDGKVIRWIFEFEDGDLAIGTNMGLFRQVNGQITEIGVDLGLSNETFSNFWPGENNLWTVSEGKHLVSFKRNSDTVSVHNVRNGFTIKGPTSIIIDNDNGVWFTNFGGLHRVSSEELQRNVIFQDSLKNIEDYRANVTVWPPGFPANWKTTEGKIYYTSPDGIVYVEPDFRATRAMNYHLESVDIDGEKYKLDSDLNLKAANKKLVFYFSTIDFINHGNILFEYKMEGFDSEWYRVGQSREITYTNLPAGDYNFRLREVSSDGTYEDWNQSIYISKAQHWYKTNFALVSYVIVILIAASTFNKLKNRNIRMQNSRLQTLVKSRTARLQEVLSHLEQKVEERTSDLKSANDQLNLAMEAGKHAAFIWHYDQDHIPRGDYSDRYYSLLGYEVQEFQPTFNTWKERVHPDDREATFAKVNEVLESLKTEQPIESFEMTYRVRKKSGEYIWVESHAKIHENVDGTGQQALIGLLTDINERQLAELEQKSAQERFEKIFEAGTNGMLLVSKAGEIVMHNQRASEIFGYQADEWKSLKIEDLVPSEYRKSHSRHRHHYHENSEPRIMRAEADFNALTKNGTRIQVQIGLNPISIRDEKFTLAVIIDMTERIRMENALIESKDQLKKERDKYVGVFQNINDGLFIVDVLEDGSFKYQEFNKTHEMLTGMSNYAVSGKPVEKVFPDIARYLNWRYASCRDSMEVITFHEQLEFKTGKKDFQTSLVPLIRGNKVMSIIGITRDITEILSAERIIRSKEEKLRYALEASQDAFVDWNLTESTIEFSQALYRMLGYEGDELEQSLESLMSLVSPVDLGNTTPESLSRTVVQLSDDQFTREFRMKKKDKSWLWVLLKGKIVERDAGKATRFVGAITDISWEKQRTKEKLEAVLITEDNERSRISKEIHDGLQQLLTISSLNFEFIKREHEQLSKKAQERLEIGWDYLQKSIEDSRTLAHTLMPKAIVDFGLVSACKSLIMAVDGSCEDTDFRFQENLGEMRIPDKNVEVTLYRILQEALNNIVKYAKATEVSVQLRNYSDVIMMTIEDNGVGFNVEKVRRNGKGFGLKSMQNRIDAISGHLEIDSQPGHGTSVVIEISQKHINS